MNRFKREIRNKGVMLRHDYLFLPFRTHGNISVEDVHVNSETATVTTFYNVGNYQVELSRNGNLVVI